MKKEIQVLKQTIQITNNVQTEQIEQLKSFIANLFKSGKNPNIFKTPFNMYYGIIQSLISQNQSFVTAACPSTNAGNISSLFKFDDQYWQSGNNQNNHLTITLTNKKAKLTGYYLKSPGTNYGSHLPYNWRLEGSNDNNQFETIDTQNACPYLIQAPFEHVFYCYPNSAYQYFRFYQHSTNGNGSYLLTLSFVELYGEIFSLEN